ncbi:carboxypeptidase M32 [Algisphaera agarilytica]|uniref:Metal-dependent carboxypeptidase n=1 Tax=Algisphaera agarilytica TaxID=1385975 RepID=A0A7X0H506_9BACT|nr:carboxypeptidase M32 [Algisphaera agarilytica]MBB6428256.1 carboxypeptidase Taq [Algisphaera agarilytica]
MDSPATTSQAYTELLDHQRDASLLSSTASLLGWDQEVMMPPGGLEHRSRQLAQLAQMVHARSTDPRIADWLSACEADDSVTKDPLSDAAVNVREWRRGYDRSTKLPAALVVEMSETTSKAKAEWAEARKADEYARFAPWLDKIIELSRKQAECYGWSDDGEPWDALAEGYEAGMTAAYVEGVFTPLRDRLVGLLDRLMGAGAQPDNGFNELELPIAQQEAFVREVSAAVGFDYGRGRLDVSSHPFCSGTHYADIRLTTRFAKNNVNDALGSTLHETGHGLYEQGLPAEHLGTPRGNAVGLSIHESQSRLWENQVGRSRAFWTWCFPKLAQYFGDAVGGLSPDAVYAAANRVQPSLIRVEADEATYNLHIMIRFELERAMLKGDIKAADLPEAWNQKYRDYLGIDVPSDAQGCLQDIHWSMGALGYFPTYTLGNLYSAQFFEAACEALGGSDTVHGMFERGEFAPLLDWLRTNIHSSGNTYHSAELCKHVTGKDLSADPLMRQLENKLLPIYGL